MAPGSVQVDDEGRTWERRTFAGPLPPGTITSLAIVFDEGTEFAGFVYLDNIQAVPEPTGGALIGLGFAAMAARRRRRR